jgi:hypothetical protein
MNHLSPQDFKNLDAISTMGISMIEVRTEREC